MSMPPLLGTVLTVLFLVTGSYAALRLAALVSGRSRDGDRVAELSHLLMSLAMIAMAWCSSAGSWLQTLVFGAFGLYFLARLATGAGHDRTTSGYHLLMSAAMVWMVVGMPVLMGGMADVPATAGSSGMAGMPGMGGPSDATASSAPGWATALSVAFAVALVVAAAWWVSHAIRASNAVVAVASGPAGTADRPPRPLSPRNDALCHTLMCVGMVAMLLAMT